MNARETEILIQKYWDCETSREEERMLREFFSEGDIPEHLLQYKSIFAYQIEQAELSLSADFDEKIMNLISEEKPRKKISLFAQSMRVAAVAFLCLAAAGITAYFSDSKKTQEYTDTYSDPGEALYVIRNVVFAVGTNIQEGREESVEAMSKLNKFDEYIKDIDDDDNIED